MRRHRQKTRTKAIKRYFIIWLLLLNTSALVSQNETLNQIDPAQIEIREFDESKLADYRADGSYDYEVYKEVEKGAFQRFIDRIWGWFQRLIGSGTTGRIIQYGIYVIGFLALIFFIIKIFGIEVNTLFKAGKKSAQTFEVTEESLDQINFEEEIQKAEQAGQWRLAIRLIYLRALKDMADRELILVKKGKTNQDYLYEIDSVALKESFSGLSFIFDYTWYGHFEANVELLNKVKGYFGEIEKRDQAA